MVIGAEESSGKRERGAGAALPRPTTSTPSASATTAPVSGAEPPARGEGSSPWLEGVSAAGGGVLLSGRPRGLAPARWWRGRGGGSCRGFVAPGGGRRPRLVLDTTPTAVLIRQVLGAVSQFEKAALVAKLKSARDRKKRETGKCGGRKSYAERDGAMVMLAKKLARYPVNGRKRSLREIAVELQAQGYVNERGVVFNPKSISSMLGRLL